MDFIKNMSPTTKSKLLVTSGMLGFVAVFILLAELSKKDETKKVRRAEKVRILVTRDPRSLGMDAVTARTLSLEKQQEKLKIENNKLREALKDLKAQTAPNRRIQTEIAGLEARDKHIQDELKKSKKELLAFFEDLIKQSPTISKEWKNAAKLESRPRLTASNEKENAEVKRKPNSYATRQQFSYGSAVSSTSETAKKEHLSNEYRLNEPNQYPNNYKDNRHSKLLMIIESQEKSEDLPKDVDDNEPNIYLPQGAILTGVMITGMDAPTNASAQETPYPSLVRIKKEAILPNYRTLQQVRECFALLGGYGELSSERVMFRGEGISCVREDGSVIETKFSAYAVGEDAKAGLRGRLVSRNSRVLVNAMLSGFASGLASAFDVSPVPVIATESDGAQQYQEVFSRSAVQGGVAKGASNAMEKLADYYMELADATHPVIEISSGRIINIVVTQGTVMM